MPLVEFVRAAASERFGFQVIRTGARSRFFARQQVPAQVEGH